MQINFLYCFSHFFFLITSERCPHQFFLMYSYRFLRSNFSLQFTFLIILRIASYFVVSNFDVIVTFIVQTSAEYIKMLFTIDQNILVIYSSHHMLFNILIMARLGIPFLIFISIRSLLPKATFKFFKSFSVFGNPNLEFRPFQESFTTLSNLFLTFKFLKIHSFPYHVCTHPILSRLGHQRIFFF